MGKWLDTHLSEEDRQALEQMVKKSPEWRARERAKTLLLLGQSLLCREVVQVQDLNICTVGQTWRHWRQEGIACLSDKPRKLDEAAAQRLTPVGTRAAFECTRAAAAPHSCKGRTGPYRYPHLMFEGRRVGVEVHTPQPQKKEMTQLLSAAGERSKN